MSGPPTSSHGRARLRLIPALAVLVALVAGCGATDGFGPFATDTPPASSSVPPSTTTITEDSSDATGQSATASPSPTASPAASKTALYGFSGHLMWDSEADAAAALDMLAEDGLDLVRFDVSWRNMEPQPGQYAFLDKLDAIVAAAEARRIRVVITVVETPGWANGRRDAWTPPARRSDYARFVGMLAERYRGRVLGWEIWNEPDLPLFWTPAPDPVRYARLLESASAAVRAADPGARVVAAGATFGNFSFLQALYDAGARGSFDAVAVHPYTLTHGPDDTSDRAHSLTAILDDAHALMAANGDGQLPIWVTELGWAVVGLNSVSAAKRVQYLPRAVELIAERPWVEVLAAYTIDVRHSERYGLSKDGVRSAAWKSYVAAVRKVRGQ